MLGISVGVAPVDGIGLLAVLAEPEALEPFGLWPCWPLFVPLLVFVPELLFESVLLGWLAVLSVVLLLFWLDPDFSVALFCSFWLDVLLSGAFIRS